MIDEKNQKHKAYNTLLRQISDIRAGIENNEEHLVFKSSILRILQAMEDDLMQESPDKGNLNKNADSIFRLVTESAKLERSEIGKELLAMLETLHGFLIELKE